MNTDPYGDGWMIKLRMTDPSERDGLLDATEYEAQAGQVGTSSRRGFRSDSERRSARLVDGVRCELALTTTARLHALARTRPPHTRPSAGTSRSGCGRRTRSRRAQPPARTCARASTAPGTPPARARTRASHASLTTRVAACAARASAGCRRGRDVPTSISRISSRIAISASQKRSSSAFDSLSVGSIISVPATGKRHRRRVEAVVHQPLGDVLDLDARALLERRADRRCTRARPCRSCPCRAPG